MKRITKEQRKRYNQIADRHTRLEADASNSLNLALLLIINLGLAFVSVSYLPKPYGGYGGLFFIAMAILFIIGSKFQNNDHIEIK